MKIDGVFKTEQSKNIRCIFETKESGVVTLECDSLFSSNNKFTEENIYGEAEDKKIISLIKPLYLRKSKYGNTSILSPKITFISKSKIIEIDDIYKELNITEFGFTIPNINRFFCENRSHEEQDYHYPFDKKINIEHMEGNNKIDIELASKHNFSDGKRRTFVTFKSNSPFNLIFFSELKHKILSFLSLCVEKLPIQTDTYIEDEEYGYSEIFYNTIYSNEYTEIKPNRNCLILFNHTKLHETIKRWLELYTQIQPLINLYILPIR